MQGSLIVHVHTGCVHTYMSTRAHYCIMYVQQLCSHDCIHTDYRNLAVGEEVHSAVHCGLVVHLAAGHPNGPPQLRH